VGRSRRRYTDEDVANAVARAVSIADALRRLGLVPAGGNYELLYQRIRQLGLNTDHLLGQAWRRGNRIPPLKARSLEEICTEGSYYKTSLLKERLIREGIRSRACEECGLTHWRGLPIPLELNHINGRRDDNRLENIQLVCPNCHALTPTYRGRNIGKAR
jgi:5-methylcytosine-specific restriction endonuclease McrA